MCYHTSVPARTELKEIFDYSVITEQWKSHYDYLNGYTYAQLPILRAEDPSAIAAYNWGLVAKWAKDKQQADMLRKGCLNAKSEDIWETASYRDIIQEQRCLIIIDGFYEFQHINKTEKIPYFIKLKNQNAFACGGVYESWQDPTSGEIRNTCSIITTPANPLMAKIHNTKFRMPFIMTKKTMMEWINPRLERKEINELMQPLNEDLMEGYTIKKFNPQNQELNNKPAIKLPFQYAQLSLF